MNHMRTQKISSSFQLISTCNHTWSHSNCQYLSIHTEIYKFHRFNSLKGNSAWSFHQIWWSDGTDPRDPSCCWTWPILNSNSFPFSPTQNPSFLILWPIRCVFHGRLDTYDAYYYEMHAPRPRPKPYMFRGHKKPCYITSTGFLRAIKSCLQLHADRNGWGNRCKISLISFDF